MPPTLYLLDGHALAYRAYFALTRGNQSFTTRAGEPTAGVYGFASILMRILEQERPEYLAVAFDTGKTFRDEIFPDYKATRAKMPEDLRPQIGRIRQLVDAFHIPRLEVEGYEADDVLGSIARRAAAQGFGVKIITGDRDLLQLVDDRILVNLPGKTIAEAKDYRAPDVLAYLGVRPDQVVDYKALVGDKSDNIPGVAGIGEKTAATLLEKYGTLEALYEHLDEIGGAVQKKLAAGRESAWMSHKLAAIVDTVPIAFDLEAAKAGQFDNDTLETMFRELEFRSLVARLTSVQKIYAQAASAAGEVSPQEPGLRGPGSKKSQQLTLFGEAAPAVETSIQVLRDAPAPEGPVAYEIVDTPEALEALVRRLTSARLIAFDTETTSTDPMRADLVGISLAVEVDQGYYLPVGHTTGVQLAKEAIFSALRGPMTEARIPKAGHNIKYDYVMLIRNGLRTAPLAFDTMIAEWLCNPVSHNLGLKGLAWARLNVKMTEIDTLIGKGKDQISMAAVPIPQAAAYAAADAVMTLRLVADLREDLERSSATKLFETMEMPLVAVLADMEMAGIALDSAFLERMSVELNGRMRTLEDQVYAAVGEHFNLNSTQQLSAALFDRLKLTPPAGTKRTASGHYSTSAEVLDYLRGKHPAVDWVLDYRELSKLKSTYVDALPQEVNPMTGRIHTSYNQTGSVTGRLASSDPNLQNIPIRTELGRVVRQAFVADPGSKLLSVDYSQVELRIAASMSGDEAMLAAFRAEEDIHTATAAAVYGVSLSAVTKEQRRAAKAINFGLIYGMSAFGLTRSTELTLAEAEDFVDRYFARFPGVKQYLDGMRRQAAEQGYVETLLGRRRYFPGLKNQQDRNVRNREEREAINAPIQGTAADIMKIAMLRVPAAIKEAGLAGRMLLQVHDELVLECPANEVAATAKLVQRVMEEAYTLNAPLRTEARSGTNWGEMTPLGKTE